jgi:multiple sugar transport system substrate-binding protein
MFSVLPEAAAAFARFLIRESTQKDILLSMGLLPAHRGVYLDPRVIERLPYVRRLMATLERAQPRPVTPYYSMISQILQPELSAIVAGLRTAEEAMARANAQLDHLLGTP